MDVVKTTGVRGGGFLLPFSKFRIFPGLPLRQSIPRLLVIAVGVFFFGYQNSVNAQITILHSFGDGSVSNDGIHPSAGLVQAPNGDFFGVTQQQQNTPKSTDGTVFQMTPSRAVSVIYRFPRKSSLYPVEPLLHYRGKLIGVTDATSTGLGDLFALTKAISTGRWRLTFWQQNFGPSGNVILGSDGFFYGDTFSTVFKLDPNTHQLTTVYNLPVGGNFDITGGLVEGNDGNFYGATLYLTGQHYASGATFKMTPSGQFTFSQLMPLFATAPLIQASDGNFYGISRPDNDPGVQSPGFVFELRSDGTLGILHLFGQGTDGAFPGAGTLVQAPNGKLYGTTSLGGTAGSGIIFEISTLGVYTVVHNFRDGSVPNDGTDPVGTLIVGKDNNLYGTTGGGGSAGLGTIFKFSP
jgi:uncharacterized repeat protein (TIGR03803 family)